MNIKIWICPNCGDLMDYRGTSYQEAMDMISVDESRRAAMEDGVDETYEGMRIEIVTIDRDYIFNCWMDVMIN